MSIVTLINKVFGRLTVIEKTDKRTSSGHTIYRCKCLCGNEKITSSYLLKSGKVKSCGCLRKDVPNRFSHLMSYSREFKIWSEMKKRCYNKNHKSYDYYGGRGILVCKQWESFEVFFNDMGSCPKRFTLDRIDCNKNYEPSNCRWASRKEQSRNKRNNRLITFQGKTMCIAEWAEQIGLKRDTLKRRIYLGWSIERALTEGVNV